MHNQQTNPTKSPFGKGEFKGIHHLIWVFIYDMYPRVCDFLNNCFFFLLKATGVLLLKAFYSIEVENRSRIPHQGPLIVAANHFSYMDPVVLQSMFPRRIFYMMTELYYEGRGKRLFQFLRCICVKEKGSNITALREGLEVLKKNSVLGIFPEGGVSSEGRIQEGNPGIGFLVIKSGAPVIPAFISGTYEALPKGKIIPGISKIKIILGNPMRFENFKNTKKEGVGEITRQIMEQIKELSFSVKQTK
ncbi:MAG: 1-acyl-sn-glycerol-3-phosphate acyltransferase [Candidatus Brocadia sp.]|nr:1-acyl-sn-glycerol-3-phosphate acyltransferase [Candidatus Brocadia sp.]